MTFSILTVCTGNICRSPLAEQMLRTGTTQWPEVKIASAGTLALVGDGMPEPAQKLSRALGGVNPEAHTARDLTADHVRDFDLILGLSREHRRRAVELLPRASRRTYTLREFARLAEGITAEDLSNAAALDLSDRSGRLAELVEVVASRRGMVEPPEYPADDDVVDPYRRGDDVYRASADQLLPAVHVVLAQFALALAVTSP